MKRRIVLAAGTFVASLALSALAADTDSYPKGQLPGGVAPTHYSLDLTIVPTQPTFSGKVLIDAKLDKPASLIWLHGRELKVSEAKVLDDKGAATSATWTEIPDSDGVAKLTLPKPMSGKIQIAITYTAEFNRRLEGIYRSDEAGEAYVYSQMEPIDARRAFPSFDEPRFKVPFDIALTVPSADAAISNGSVVKEAPAGAGLKRLTFATTKPLPTYLIAVAVGPFDVVTWTPIPKTAVRNREVPLRGITAKGKGDQIKYALSNTAGLLTTLENYFGREYPYEKLDIIAATDFSAGAMENAGAIVYREPLMLMDESSPLSVKRRFAVVHAHEMSHQWFGDLVTPAWWNDIWLNESFATWMEYKTADTWNPKGEYGRLTLSAALGVMQADSKASARRIAQPIESMDDIQNAFDGITYEKGGGVLNMFEHYYGVDGFRKGVQLYFERHAFGVATAKDFLQAIADANKDTKGVAAFETFLNQAGVPQVTAELTCTNNTAQVNVTQTRYFPLGAATPPRENQKWTIPMCIVHGDKTGRDETCTMVEGAAAKIPLKSKTCPTWFMPNADGAGYFRFALTKQGWDALTAAANTLTEKEVLAAMASMDAAYQTGEMDTGDYLTRVKAMLARDGGNATWDVASEPMSRLTWIREVLLPPASQPKAEKYIAGLYGPLYAKIGLAPTTALDKSSPNEATLMRTPVVNMMAQQARVPAVRGELAKRGAAYLGLAPDGKPGDGKIHPEAVDANVTDQAVNVAVQELGAPVVDAIVRHMKTERNAVIRGRLLGALNRSTDPALATKVRGLLFTEELRVNEVPILVYGSVGERANMAAGWAWFKTNFDAIKNKVPPGGRGGLAGIGGRFCSKAERDDYKAFMEPKIGDLEGGPRIFAATLESIDNCIALTAKQRANAEAYFAKN